MTYLADANILVRFLVDDNNVHSPAVRKFVHEAQAGRVNILVPFIAITECVFVLESFYRIDRADIGQSLLTLLRSRGLTLTCPNWVLNALEDYRDKNVSFGDACLVAEFRAGPATVASFDKSLSTKFPGLKRYEPKA